MTDIKVCFWYMVYVVAINIVILNVTHFFLGVTTFSYYVSLALSFYAGYWIVAKTTLGDYLIDRLKR